jgi:signal peptidase I
MEKNKEYILEEKEKEQKTPKVIKEIIPYVIIIFVVLFIKAYIVSPIQVNGESMDHTLKHGDIMILNKIQYKRNGVERFDIVVVDDEGTSIIKRVIGLPGEVIEVIDNKLYIDGKLYKEEYLDDDTITYDFTTKVDKNCYFVMGDNREKSKDSRLIGCIKEENIEGIAKLTIFPFNRIGNKK